MINRTNYIVKGIIYALFSALAMQSCDVHEWPEEVPPEIVPYTLHLDFDTRMPIYEEISFSGTRGDESYDRRYIIGVYPYDKAGNPTRVADTMIVFTKSTDEEYNHSIQLDIPEGKYNFLVWKDYVDTKAKSDLYYNTSDFTEIILANRKKHVGNTDFRDAFRGEMTSIVLAEKSYHQSLARTVSTEVIIPMERPLAKYKVIATDLQEFIRHAKRLIIQKAANREDGTRADLHEFNIEEYRVVFCYNGFMPCSFNMFTNRPADAWTGVTFEGGLTPLSDDEVELGFDYIFVNGSESTVSITIEVYDWENELVSRSSPITVPITRSQLTVVRGNFLTSKAEGGVGIVPEFDGDYNYVVP